MNAGAHPLVAKANESPIDLLILIKQPSHPRVSFSPRSGWKHDKSPTVPQNMMLTFCKLSPVAAETDWESYPNQGMMTSVPDCLAVFMFHVSCSSGLCHVQSGMDGCLACLGYIVWSRSNRINSESVLLVLHLCMSLGEYHLGSL